MKKKRNHIISAIILFITAAVIIASYILLEHIDSFYVSEDCVTNKGLSTDNYVVVLTYGKESNGKLKKWTSDGKTGAEYDFTVYNDTNEDLNDWFVTIQLPEGSYIDSGWDGSYTIDEAGLLTSTPETYNKEIFANSNRVFGFVLYTPHELDLNDLTVTVHGLTNFSFDTTKAFYILYIAAALWFAGLSLFLFNLFRGRVYEKRRKKDQEIITQSIRTFVNFIDAKDRYTRGHSNRVALYSREIARRMHMPEDEVEHLYYIALMHDAGKIGVPDYILTKDGPLDHSQYEQIKNHTTIGGEMLKSFTAIPGISEGALYHHERYDGNGYPKGLAGEDIPLCARIICVADSYDAMSSDRCYRAHLSKEVILKELENNSGSQFDPKLIPYMISMIEDGFTEKIHKLYDENSDQPATASDSSELESETQTSARKDEE